MQKVRLDAGRREVGAVGLEKDDADDVVTDVALALQLLRVVLLVGQQRRNVEHDLDATPVRVHRVKTRQVVHRVQAALVLVEAFQTHLPSLHFQSCSRQLSFLYMIESYSMVSFLPKLLILLDLTRFPWHVSMF